MRRSEGRNIKMRRGRGNARDRNKIKEDAVGERKDTKRPWKMCVMKEVKESEQMVKDGDWMWK